MAGGVRRAASWAIAAVAAVVSVAVLVALVGGLTAAVLYTLLVPPSHPAPPPARSPGSRPALVAIGDSYMSGEGASTFYPGTDGPHDKCRRAPTAYPVRVAEQLGADLRFVACSGARTINVTPDLGLPDVPSELQYPDSNEGFQIAALQAHPDAAVVLLSLGGNDAKFSEVVGLCMGGGSPCQEKAAAWYDTMRSALQPRLRAVYAQVRATAPQARVFAMTYPMPFAADVTSCPQLHIDPGEVTFLREFVTRLNEEIWLAATASDVATVDLSHALDGGGLCRPAGSEELLHGWSWRKPAGISRDPVDPVRGSFHPSEAGHRAIADVVLRTFAEPPPPPAPEPPPGMPRVPPSRPPDVPPDYTPPVGPFPLSPNPCATEAAVQEVVALPGGPDHLTGGLPDSPVCFRTYVEAWHTTRLDARGNLTIPFQGRAVGGLGGYRTVVYQEASGVWVVRVLLPSLSAAPSDLNMARAWVTGAPWARPVIGLGALMALGAVAGVTVLLHRRLAGGD